MPHLGFGDGLHMFAYYVHSQLKLLSFELGFGGLGKRTKTNSTYGNIKEAKMFKSVKKIIK